MVIISRDDYRTFLNEIGSRMQNLSDAAVASNTLNSTVQTSVSENCLVPGVNVAGSNSNKRSASQDVVSSTLNQFQPHFQLLQQAAQHQQQQSQLTLTNNGSNNGNKLHQAARAILICRPNSHPFQNRTLFLEANVEIKIGRSVARTKVSDTNAIFDCKVLSRNHAVIWYSDGKFFIRDTGSSNGTFINNNRLSPTTVQSEPFEVSSGDIVQFGVDVMENSRKETHGCIVATLKLFLPDGRETKASHSTIVGAVSTNIEPSDLFRLNQYVQEIVQRDQILETKFQVIQKTVDKARKNSTQVWQAFIDEDRLLSRIDMLEKKLQSMQKNVAEDKLREEVVKMQEEKLLYETTAKETLRKVYQERSEAVQRLTAIQRALCSSENECSLLREQISKLNQEVQNLTEKYSAIQKDLDEKISEAQQKESLKELEITTLKKNLTVLEERLTFIQENCDSDDSNESMRVNVGRWNKENSSLSLKEANNINEEVINAIKNENETKSDFDDKIEKAYKKIVNLESMISMLEETKINSSVENNSEIKKEEEDQSTENTSYKENVCDGNQNLDSSNASSEMRLIKKATKMLKTSIMEMIKLRNSSQKEQLEKVAKVEGKEEFEEQIKMLKEQLESRPLKEDYTEKIDLIEKLNDKLTLLETENLAFKLELTNNKTAIDSLQKELTHKPPPSEVQKASTDAIIQTEAPKNNSLPVPEEKVPSLEGEPNLADTESEKNLEREEELVLFKEKYAKLVEEKLQIDKELCNLRDDYQEYRNKSLINLLLYLAPIFALVAYLFIHYFK